MPISNDPKYGQIGSRSLIRAMAMSEYTVATVPAAATHKGRLIYVSDGAAGSPCLAYSNGTNWLRVVFGAAIATS